MPGLVLGIHVKASRRQQRKTWMAGTRPAAGPAMTVEPRARTATLLASTVCAILENPAELLKGIRQKGGRRKTRPGGCIGWPHVHAGPPELCSAAVSTNEAFVLLYPRARNVKDVKLAPPCRPSPALIRLPGERGSARLPS